MKTVRVLALIAIAAPILAGCGATSDSGATPTASDDPIASAVAYDPSVPLPPQMRVAIDANDANLAEQVLAAGYDPATELGAGVSTLHLAAARDAYDVIPVLVAAGADLEARSSRQTPLMFAVKTAGAKTVVALLEAGADPYVADAGNFGAAAIHLAAQTNNVEAIDAFITWGVDVNLWDAHKSSPLIWAAFFGALEVSEYLLDAGADVNWRDDFGDTPLNLVDQTDNPELAQLLIDAGGHI